MIKKRIAGCFFLSVFIVSLLSCATGQYMDLKDNEGTEILGITRATFEISGAFRYRSAINSQAYINLLAEARNEYQGLVDIRDITWAIGKSDTVNNNYEYTAIGTVIRR